ncbi:MAG: hypothetical protein KAR39_01020 [Thermoplasmata archaeon]|nr:hypothetical protein [Thermoplasmata archaeon]
MIDDMLNRCIRCGERCNKGGSQWGACAELSDEEWVAVFESGALVLLGFEGIEVQ